MARGLLTVLLEVQRQKPKADEPAVYGTKDSTFIQKVYRVGPWDKVGILDKGLSEDIRPRLENFEDNFIIILKIWGKEFQVMVSHRPRENILTLSGRHKLQLSTPVA